MKNIKRIVLFYLFSSMQISLAMPLTLPLVLGIAEKLMRLIPSRQTFNNLKSWIPTETIKTHKNYIGISIFFIIITAIIYSQEQDPAKKKIKEIIIEEINRCKHQENLFSLLLKLFKKNLNGWEIKDLFFGNIFDSSNNIAKKYLLNTMTTALQNNDLDTLEILIENPLTAKKIIDPNARIPIILVNKEGSIQAIPNIQNEDNPSQPKQWITPLQFAWFYQSLLSNKLKLLPLLLDHGANPLEKDHLGNSILHTILFDLINNNPARLNQENTIIKIIDLLLKANARPDMPNSTGQTCMHLVSLIKNPITRQLIAETLIMNNLNMAIVMPLTIGKTLIQLTPLFYATYFGNAELVELFLEKTSATIDQLCPKNHSILIFAIDRFINKTADTNKLKLIIDYLFNRRDIGKIIDLPNTSGQRPIHYAIYSDDKEIIEKFIDDKFNIQFNDSVNNFQSPVEYAINFALKHNKSTALSVFLKKNLIPKDFTDSEGNTLAHKLVLQSNEENQQKSEAFLQQLIERNISCNTENDQHRTPFLCALIQGSLLSKWFMQNSEQLDIEKNISFSKGYTPAHIVVKCDKRILMSQLIKNGFSIEEQNVYGRNALHVAASLNHPLTAQYLNNQDPSLISVQDNWGNTPLHLVAQKGHRALYDILKTPDTELMQNNKGKTPLQLLQKNQSTYRNTADKAKFLWQGTKKKFKEILKY